MNVPDFFNPRKEVGKSVYIGLIMVLIAAISFGLGRLSVAEDLKSGLTVLYPSGMKEEAVGASAIVGYKQAEASAFVGQKTVATSAPPQASSGPIVASKSGTKYHLITCSGAKSIKPDNKIYFASVDEARAAGYTPAANCKGLK